MTSGIKGSAYEPTAEIAARLTNWRRMASRGMRLNDIAADLGISRDTLVHTVVRARKHGHPDAILHPNAAIPGTGTSHLTDSTVRARRTRRRAIERHTP